MGLFGSLFGGAAGGSEAARLFVSVGADIKKAEVGLDRIGQKTDATQTKLGGLSPAAKAAGIGVAAGLALSVAAAAGFDAKMTQSLAIMGDVSAETRAEMERTARDVAKTTTFSAEQAAESYFFLASAGLSAEAQISAMPQVAKFAQAGMFDMARATDLLTDAQSALGLTIRDDAVANMENMIRVSDVLVRANTLSNATVEQFSESLTNKAGAALRLLGKDVEEGVAVLAAFADQGVKGSEAGEKLNIVLRDLQRSALAETEAFAAAGIAVFDSSGEMRNMADIVDDLSAHLDGMSDAQKRVALETLGFQDKSMSATMMLLGMGDAIRDYESGLRDAAGFTDQVAAKQMESFTAKLTVLWHKLVDIGIGIGLVLLPPLGFLADALGVVATVLGYLPPEVWLGIAAAVATAVVPAIWSAAAAMAGLSLASLPITGTFLLIAGAVALLALGFRTNFLWIRDIVDSVMGFIGGILGRIAGAILEVGEIIVGVAAAIPGPWQEGAQEVAAQLDLMHAKVDEWAGVTDAALVRQEASWQSYQNAIRGIVDETVSDVAAGGDAMDAAAMELTDGLPDAMEDANAEATEVASRTPGDLANGLRASLDDYQTALDELTEVTVNSVSDLRERQEIEGILASQELTDALNSDSTRTRLMAQDLVDDLTADYNLLAPGALQAGELVNPALSEGLYSNISLAVDAADEVNSRIEEELDVGFRAYAWGRTYGQSFRDGMMSYWGEIAAASRSLGDAAAVGIRLRSPAEEGALSEPADEWGVKLGMMLASGMMQSERDVAAASLRIGSAAASGIRLGFPATGGVAAGSGAPSGFGGRTTAINAPLVHIERFEGTPANVDRLADKIAERLRLQT